MFTELFGSVSQERALIFILCRGSGYAREIARFYDTGLISIQKQLAKLDGGILVSEQLGRTRMYSFNPRYALLPELQALLRKSLEFYPPEELERLQVTRTRPRRQGKP